MFGFKERSKTQEPKVKAPEIVIKEQLEKITNLINKNDVGNALREISVCDGMIQQLSMVQQGKISMWWGGVATVAKQAAGMPVTMAGQLISNLKPSILNVYNLLS